MQSPMRIIPRPCAGESEPKTIVYISQTAVITGEVSLGEDCNIWHGAVIRGDEAPISVGDGTNVQDCAVLHCDPGVPLKVGAYVTIGHNAVLHCSEVGDRVIVGMGAILLTGSKIGSDSLVAAGAVVTPNKVFPPRSLIMGSPAKVARELTQEEVERITESAHHYIQNARSAVNAKRYGE